MLVRKRRGNNDSLKTYKGSPHEVVVNTDHRSLILFDGETPGGFTIGDEVLIQGPEEVVAGIPNVFTIVNYDAFSNYIVSSNVGSVEISGSKITLWLEEDVLNIVFTVSREGASTRVLEIPGNINLGPGPLMLSAGDMTAGFFGEVGPTDLITYEDLASYIGLTSGVSQFNEESRWLKFALDEKILFVALKPSRHSISWSHLHARNAVYGDLEVEVRDFQFKCRLLKGVSVETGNMFSGWNPVQTIDSEWNRLMYPIHSGIHRERRNPSLPEMGTWAEYNDEDLLVHDFYGNGVRTWSQETRTGYPDQRIYRGNTGITYCGRISDISDDVSYGWRPVLELIP